MAGAIDVPKTNDPFVKLLTENEPKVYAYILSLVPCWSDADEILQETHVRLWQQFHQFQPGTDFAAWAITIAHYQVLTYRKRHGREKMLCSQEFIEAVSSEVKRTQREQDRREGHLQECLERLNASGRALVDLCYRRGMAICDAARQLGRSTEATYKSLSRLRQLLRRCIEDKLASEGSRW